MKTRKFRDKA